MYTLSAWDYVVIVVMLFISAGIGVYFAFRSRRRHSSSDYFLGDRGMSTISVALSLTATYVSAITYLGIPAEVYLHGPKFGLMITSRLFVPFVAMYCFIPVFYRLEITTVYEYLAMRFNNTVRFLVITVVFLSSFTYMGIVVYTPALALSTVTGMNLNFSILAIGIICTFYTTIGGIKAVIWTDVFQALTMVTGATVMILVGTIKIGGPAEGWRRAAAGQRTELIDFNIDPTVRLTFWTTFIGGISYLLMVAGTKQSFVQRYLACKSENDAQIATMIGLFGTGVMELLAVATGMTVFAYYYTCDPLTAKEIERPDQIVPYFIMDVFHSVPGVPGILIASAFCASLSSMSSVLNAIASMTGEDIIKSIWPNIADRHYSIVIKMISALFGVFTIALAFLTSVLGDVLQTALSVIGLAGGPVFGLFIVGLFIPRGNSAGAVAGLVGGTAVGLFFYVGSKVYPQVGQGLPLSTESCTGLFETETTTFIAGDMLTENFSTYNASTGPFIEDEHGPAIFGLSYFYITTVTTLASVLIGLAVSYVTSWNNPQFAHPKLLVPFIAHHMERALAEDKKSRRPEHPSEENLPLQKA